MTVLQGIRVLDLGRFIAGPYCAALLADYGADVIRVDRVGGAEDRTILPVSSQGEGAQFLQVNRNKRSIALEIDTPDGQRVLHDLVRRADVVIANMPPRTLVKLGLDYESLRRIKPDVILTASTAFGTSEAVSDRVGFDGVAQCMSGAVHMSGLPDHPVKIMAPVVDFGTGMACALGTMMALYERKTSGMGQEVGASLLRTALTYSSGSLIEEAALGVDRKATMNRAPHYAPSDMFRCSDDRWIIAQVIGAGMFKRWARVVGRPELADDPRLQDDLARGEHGEELSRLMADWCAMRTRPQALAELEAGRVPAGAVNSPREALADPIIAAADALRPTDFPGLPQPVPLTATPVELSRTPPSIRRRPPSCGEHTEEVLQEIGYSPEAIAALRAKGVV